MALQKFNPSLLTECPTRSVFVVYGKRGTGKSVLIEDLLSHLPCTRVVAMTGTYESQQRMSKLNNIDLYDRFEPEAIEALLDSQQKLRKELLKEQKWLHHCPEHHVCVVLNDLAYDSKTFHSNAFRQLIFNGRELGIKVILGLQYPMELRPDIRANIDYVFVFRDNNNDNLSRFYRYFFGTFNSFIEFKEILKANTEDYKCLVLDNCVNIVMWYKASLDAMSKRPDNNFRGHDDKRLKIDE
jgi:hypothetical protein